MAFTIPVEVRRPPRRNNWPEGKSDFFLNVQALTLTRSWGSQPDEGALTYVADRANGYFDDPARVITPGSELWIRLYGRTYYGICVNGPRVDDQTGLAQAMEQSSRGHSVTIHFVDHRHFMKSDVVFGVWNREVRETTTVGAARTIFGHGYLPGSGENEVVRIRYYRHLTPSNYRRQMWSYTPGPLTARQVIGYILGADTVGSPWVVAGWHDDQQRYPVYEVDAESGRKLDDLLQEVCDQQGLTFTVQEGPYSLWFGRKGEGALYGDFLQRSDDIQIARQLSGNPTRVFVLGDRNIYLQLNQTLAADWNAAYEEFRSPIDFNHDIFTRDTVLVKMPDGGTARVPFNQVPGDNADMGYPIGRQLAAARAAEITVAEYAALRGDANFRDARSWGGKARSQMPVRLYLSELVYRAFRPPAAFNINGHQVRTRFLRLTETMPARVTHDPASGRMTAHLNETADGTGCVIARGYNVGVDIFRNTNPDQFDVNQFLHTTDLWSRVDFTIDPGGEEGQFIILSAPVVISGRNGDGQALVASENNLSFLVADVPMRAPEVRASLAYEWDRYRLTWPQNSNNPGRDEVATVPGLHAEYIVGEGQIEGVGALGAGQIYEVFYSDGASADGKGQVIAETLLRRQWLFEQGGFTYKLQESDTLPVLVGIISRMSLQASSQGQVLRVDYTTERPERFARRPTDLDRTARQQSLLPGQAELRHLARLHRLDAVGAALNPRAIEHAGALLEVMLGTKTKPGTTRVQ